MRTRTAIVKDPLHYPEAARCSTQMMPAHACMQVSGIFAQSVHIVYVFLGIHVKFSFRYRQINVMIGSCNLVGGACFTGVPHVVSGCCIVLVTLATWSWLCPFSTLWSFRKSSLDVFQQLYVYVCIRIE